MRVSVASSEQLLRDLVIFEDMDISVKPLTIPYNLSYCFRKVIISKLLRRDFKALVAPDSSFKVIVKMSHLWIKNN